MFTVSIDAGRSAVKAVLIDSINPSQRVRCLLPNATMPAVALSDQSTRDRAARNTVEVMGMTMFVGETAMTQSGPSSTPNGLNDDWFFSAEHLAVVFGAIKRLNAECPALDVAACQLYLGLPAGLFTTRLKEYRAFIREHTRSGPFQINEKNIFIHAQPWGALYSAMLNADGGDSGCIHPEHESWGVIELGHHTTDFLVLSYGDIVERTVGSCAGVRVVAEEIVREMRVQNVTASQSAITNALAGLPVKRFSDSISFNDARSTGVRALTDELNRETRSRFESLMQTLDGIILAGGGAALVEPWAKTLGPNIVVLDDPRFAVAEGFGRFSLAQQHLAAHA